MREGLDVTLNGSAVYACRWTHIGWLDASAQFIRRIDFVLDHSQFKEPIKPVKRYQKHWPIEANQPTKRPRLSDLSESSRIAIKQATHLRAVGLQPTDQTIDQTISQIRARVQALPLRSKLVRGLDQELEVWNRS